MLWDFLNERQRWLRVWLRFSFKLICFQCVWQMFFRPIFLSFQFRLSSSKKHFFSFLLYNLFVYLSSCLICFAHNATQRSHVNETMKRKSTQHEKSIRHQNLWRKIIGYDITSFKLIMAYNILILFILCDFCRRRRPRLLLHIKAS